MFKVFQIDPETSAIHVNEQALWKSKDYAILPSLVAHFFERTPGELTEELHKLSDPGLQARLAGLIGNLLHELRHYADLIFTPYGFYRLRVAFEFYNTMIPLLNDKENLEISVPLISGADPVNRQVLALHAYETSPVRRFSDIALSRMRILAHDNLSHEVSANLFVNVGGDAVLEALAYTLQSEWLITLFDTPECRSRYPQFFDDYTGSAFDLKYRWYVPLRKSLGPVEDRSVARLTQCILFASLCGSFARGAKQIFLDRKQISLDRLSEIGTRFVDDCLPSRRLGRLWEYFKARRPLGTEKWSNLYDAVDRACREIWGWGIVDEIEDDIEADQMLVHRFEKSNPWLEDDSVFPILAFRDLVETRMSLLEMFKEDPLCFIENVGFLTRLAPGLAPPVIGIHPQGLRENERFTAETTENIFVVHDREISSQLRNVETGETHDIQESIWYSYWVHRHRENRINQVRNIKAWDVVFSWLGPLYKGLLYGHRYRSMLEADIVWALEVCGTINKLVWDPDYREADDVTAPDEYFEFFDLTEAQCDVCGKVVDRKSSVLVSGLTVRQNTSFVKYFCDQQEGFVAHELLLKDWSVWLLCLDDAKIWGFVRRR